MIHTLFSSDDGIPQRDPDSYWDYRFDLTIDSASAFQGLLDLLVDYRQKRKLTQFLLHCCDVLEVLYDRHTDALLEYRFLICLSDRVTLHYSSREEDCYVHEDGEHYSYPTLTTDSQEKLYIIMKEIWTGIRNLSDWNIADEDHATVRVIRSVR